MSLNSCFVLSFSETRIRVPSERTTRSKGEISKANGSLKRSVIFKCVLNVRTYARHSIIKNAIYVSGVTPPTAPFTWFFDKLQMGTHQYLFRAPRLVEFGTTNFIAPPTSCPRLRETIHRAKYFPREPDGASDIIEPLSATYQQPVPMPVKKPPRIRY